MKKISRLERHRKSGGCWAISKTDLCFIGISVIIASTLFLTVFPALIQNLPSREIKITAIGQTSDYSRGDKVLINYIAYDDVKQNAENIGGESSGFEITQDGYGFSTDGEAELTFSAPALDFVEVAFSGNESGGYVEVNDGSDVRVLNLASQGTVVYYHPKTISFLALVLAVLIYVVAIYLLTVCIRELYVRYIIRNEWARAVLSSPLLWLLILCVIVRCYWAGLIGPYLISGDTASYSSFSFRSGSAAIRTPVYPLFIRLTNFIMGKDLSYCAVSCFQTILGLASVGLMYAIAIRLTHNTKLSFAGSAAFGCLPFAITFEHMIGAEEFAVFAALLILYMMQCFLEKPSRIMACLIGLFSLVCIMIRPSFIFLLAVLGVFWTLWLFFERPKRIFAVYGVAGVCVAVLGVVAYCAFNLNTVGVFGLTRVSTEYNTGYVITTENFYDDADQQEFTDEITKLQYEKGNKYTTYYYDLIQIYTPSELQQLIKNAAVNNNYEFANYLGAKIAKESGSQLTENTNSKNIWLGPTQLRVSDSGLKVEVILNALLCPFTMSLLYILLIVQMAMCIRQFRRTTHVPWMELGIVGILIAQIATNYIGAYAQYPRLMLPCLAIVYLLTVNIIGNLKLREPAKLEEGCLIESV